MSAVFFIFCVGYVQAQVNAPAVSVKKEIDEFLQVAPHPSKGSTNSS